MIVINITKLPSLSHSRQHLQHRRPLLCLGDEKGEGTKLVVWNDGAPTSSVRHCAWLVRIFLRSFVMVVNLIVSCVSSIGEVVAI